MRRFRDVKILSTSYGNVVTTDGTQTLTGKTLTSPTITGATLTTSTLTQPKVNEAVALLATSTELNQLDGVTVGGSTAGDIVTIDGTQTLTGKTLTTPAITDPVLGGYENVLAVAATSGTLSGTSGTITLNIPSGAILVGYTINNDQAITDDDGDDTYTAAFSGGSTIAINGGSAIAAAQNTKTKAFINVNAASAITNNTTDITLTPNGTNFTAGEVRAVVFYMTLSDLPDIT